MEKDITSISSYKETVTELTQDLAKLEIYAGQLEMESMRTSLEEFNDHIKNDRFNLAVLGEFRRGKSTLINALLRTPVLPSDIVPTTASVNRITYDPEPAAHVEYIDGTSKDIDIQDLADYATQDGDYSEGVKEVTVWYPTVYCANNVDIYDTPGLNDSEEMTRATNEVIGRMDVALFVLMAGSNFSASEADFIGNRLLTSQVGRVLFVVTHMDGYTPEEQEKILTSIRGRIEKLVVKKAEQVLADDPEQLASFKAKLGEIQIFGVSSTMALKARETKDMDLLEKSGYAAFERAIDAMLTQERGRVMLDRQTGSVLKSASDIFNIIQTRVAPLTMEEGDFQERCQQVETEITAMQTAMDEETKRLQTSQKEVQKKVADEWQVYVGQMKENMRGQIMELEVTKEDLKKKNREAYVQNVWTEKISPTISQQVNIYAEKVTNMVSEAAQQECKAIGSYADEIKEHLGKIGNILLPDEKTSLGGTGPVETLKAYLLGGNGTILSGYKTAGIKGAIVGGVSGVAFAGGLGGVAGVILALLGITPAGPVLYVAAAAAGLGGLIAGDKVVKTVFRKDRIEKFKEELANAACEELDNALEESDIQGKLDSYVRETFEGLISQVRKNTQETISDLRKTMEDIRVNFASEKAQAEQKVKDYTAMLEDLSEITDRARNVREVYHLDKVD